MKIRKFKRKAKVCMRNGRKLDLNFFLDQFAEKHAGRELILDILNSNANFVPLEDFQDNEILLINKGAIIYIKLSERDLSEETVLSPEIPVKVELTNGEILAGSFFIEMPPERSRLSDYLNFSPQFLYLCQKNGDLILNKAYMLSVKD